MKTKVIMQYYYRTNDCKARHANDADCMCWHDEGTGPQKTELHTDDAPTVEWRVKPKPTT